MAVGYPEFVHDFERWWPTYVNFYGWNQAQVFYVKLHQHHRRLAESLKGTPNDPSRYPRSVPRELFELVEARWDWSEEGGHSFHDRNPHAPFVWE